jgi:hypothetical protein
MSIPTTTTVEFFKLTHEYIIVYELTEDYSFILHNEDLSFQWIMPKNADNNLSLSICVIVSDCLSHDTVSVHL